MIDTVDVMNMTRSECNSYKRSLATISKLQLDSCHCILYSCRRLGNEFSN